MIEGNIHAPQRGTFYKGQNLKSLHPKWTISQNVMELFEGET
jgi:hypothetical protein